MAGVSWHIHPTSLRDSRQTFTQIWQKFAHIYKITRSHTFQRSGSFYTIQDHKITHTHSFWFRQVQDLFLGGLSDRGHDRRLKTSREPGLLRQREPRGERSALCEVDRHCQVLSEGWKARWLNAQSKSSALVFRLLPWEGTLRGKCFTI